MEYQSLKFGVLSAFVVTIQILTSRTKFYFFSISTCTIWYRNGITLTCWPIHPLSPSSVLLIIFYTFLDIIGRIIQSFRIATVIEEEEKWKLFRLYLNTNNNKKIKTKKYLKKCSQLRICITLLVLMLSILSEYILL